MNQTAAKQNKSKVSATTIALIALLVLAAIILVSSLVECSGIIGRVNTVASAGKYSMNENDLAVLEYQYENSVYTNLYYYSLYYKLYQNSKNVADYYCGENYYFSDVATTENSQEYAENHMKDFDIKGLAYTRAKDLIVYNLYAEKEGFKPDAKKYADSKANAGYIAINTLKEGADSNNMSLGEYIRTVIGNGVSKGDVENVIEMSAKADLFCAEKHEDLKKNMTDKEAEEFRDRLENKGYFFFTEFDYCKLPSGDWVTDKVMEAAKECKTLDELKKVLLDAYVTSELDEEAYTNHFTKTEGNGDSAPSVPLDGVPTKEEEKDGETTLVIDKDKIKADLLASLLYRTELSEDKTAFDEAWDTEKKENNKDVTLAEGYIANGSGLVDTMYKAVKTTVIGLEEDTNKAFYTDPTGKDVTDLQKWLFGDEGRKEGDVTVIKTETTNSSSTSSSTSTKTTTYTWYCIKDGDRVLVYDTEKTKDGYYVELKDDVAPKDGETETDATTGEEKEVLTKDDKYALIEAATDTDARKEVFKDKLSTSEKNYMTESALEGVGEELAAWFYAVDEEGNSVRKEGDYARITVGEGDSKKEYAVLFTKENDETWLINAKTGLATERLSELFDKWVEECGYKADYEPATETETETEAATSAATEAATSAATEATTENASENASEASSEAEGGAEDGTEGVTEGEETAA